LKDRDTLLSLIKAFVQNGGRDVEYVGKPPKGCVSIIELLPDNGDVKSRSVGGEQEALAVGNQAARRTNDGVLVAVVVGKRTIVFRVYYLDAPKT
jgi:hypothetical protein